MLSAGDNLRKFNKQSNKMLLAAYLTIKMQSGVDSNWIRYYQKQIVFEYNAISSR